MARLSHQNHMSAVTLFSNVSHPSIQQDYRSSISATQDSPLVSITTTAKSSNGWHDDAARKVVRSYVMNTYCRQKKPPIFDLLPRSTVSASSLESKPGGNVGKFKLELWNGKRRKKRSRAHKVGTDEGTACKSAPAEIPLPAPRDS
jgi:hypothetical protein